jgi:hypothetical protein
MYLDAVEHYRTIGVDHPEHEASLWAFSQSQLVALLATIQKRAPAVAEIFGPYLREFLVWWEEYVWLGDSPAWSPRRIYRLPDNPYILTPMGGCMPQM